MGIANVTGVTGKIAFDPHGDLIKPPYTLFEVQQGQWKSQRTVGGNEQPSAGSRLHPGARRRRTRDRAKIAKKPSRHSRCNWLEFRRCARTPVLSFDFAIFARRCNGAL
jgi:hypothetical protein